MKRKGAFAELFARASWRLHASSLDHHRGDGRCIPACPVRHEIRAAAVLSIVGPQRTCHRLEPAGERLDHRNQCADGAIRARTAAGKSRTSTIGRPMSGPALRGLSCRSICRRPTLGLARWSSSPRAALRRGTVSRRNSKRYLKRTFPGTDTYVKLLEVGPPVGRPVQYRLSGPDIAKVKELAQRLAGIVRRQSAPRQRRVRLDGARARRQGRRAAGQGAPAWRQLRRYCHDLEQRARRHVDHSGAGQHLPGQRRWPRDESGTRARSKRCRDLQLIGLGGRVNPARGRRQPALRYRAADDMAALAASDDHAQSQPP